MPLPAILPLLAKAGAAAAGMFTAQNVGSMVGMTAVPLIIEHMMSGPPSPENIAKIKSIIDSESMKLSQTQNIPLADAQRQMKAELEPALMEAMSSKPGAMGTLAAWVGGGIAGGHIGGKIGAKFAGKGAVVKPPAPGGEVPLPEVATPATAPAPKSAPAGVTAAATSAGGAPLAPTNDYFGKATSASAPIASDDLLKALQSAPRRTPMGVTPGQMPYVGSPKPGYQDNLITRRPEPAAAMTSPAHEVNVVPSTNITQAMDMGVTPGPMPGAKAAPMTSADDMLKAASAPPAAAADPLAAEASSAAAALAKRPPLSRSTGPVTAIPVSGPELGKAAKYLRDKGHLKPGDEAAFAAEAAGVTDGDGLRALVEKWSKPRTGGSAAEAIKARMMGFKSSKGI